MSADEAIEHVRQLIHKLRESLPYKKSGNRDSYSDYREGFNDALDAIESLDIFKEVV
jgi:hypothetical protein